MEYSKKDLIKDLQKMGLKAGDICVVRSSLRNIGKISGGKRSAVFLDALFETVGKKGTIVMLTFTDQYQLPLDPDDPKQIFTRDKPTNSGGLSAECLSRPDAIRSSHPINSYCAIGSDAHFILDGHDAKSSCFDPIGKVIEKKGKMLIIGILYSSPGFTTVHWAQWKLGLSTKSKYKNKLGAYYIDETGQKQEFLRKDIGGCSMGFSKFYDHYRKAGILVEGTVGDAPSMLVDAKKALDVELALIKKDPNFPFCDNPGCKTCRIGWEFSKTSPIIFYLRNPKKIYSLIFKRSLL